MSIGLKRIKYTPDAADKLLGLKEAVIAKYGGKKTKEIVGEIYYN